jgi:putative colanic acid biosynthesis acetyltransferase WcaF
MNDIKTDLSTFRNDWYKPGGALKRVLWYMVSTLFFKSSFPFNGVKIFFLNLFGAKIGKGIVIKPHVNIKYPWKLKVGNYAWIGEGVWIDSLGCVVIGDHSCLSQGSFLLCGNHDYKKSTFDLIVRDIILEEGVWIGAKSVVCPGVTCKSHSVLSVGSVATTDLESYSIYQGNPAVKVRDRNLSE